MARLHPPTDGGEVIGRQRSRRFVRRLQQPRFQLWRDFKGLLLLLANGADEVVDEFTGSSANTGANLVLQKVLHILVQRDVHNWTLLAAGIIGKPLIPRRGLREPAAPPLTTTALGRAAEVGAAQAHAARGSDHGRGFLLGLKSAVYW